MSVGQLTTSTAVSNVAQGGLLKLADRDKRQISAGQPHDNIRPGYTVHVLYHGAVRTGVRAHEKPDGHE